LKPRTPMRNNVNPPRPFPGLPARASLKRRIVGHLCAGQPAFPGLRARASLKPPAKVWPHAIDEHHSRAWRPGLIEARCS
jgi:hypothetical protein